MERDGQIVNVRERDEFISRLYDSSRIKIVTMGGRGVGRRVKWSRNLKH